MSQEILCRKCGKVLAVDHGDYIEIKKGASAVRIYGAVVVAFDCERCGATTDLPANMRKKMTA